VLLIAAGIIVWFNTARIARRNRAKLNVRVAAQRGGTQ